MKKTVLLILINIAVFALLLVIYFLFGFLAGYGANDSYQSNVWLMYACFCMFQLVVNIYFVSKFKKLNSLNIFLFSLEVVLLYYLGTLTF